MIHDKLAYWKTYEHLGERFRKAFLFIEEFKKNPKEDGEYSLSENVKAIVTSYETDVSKDGPMECHRAYIDVQYMLSGSEIMEWTVSGQPALKQEYNEEEDCALYENSGALKIPVLEDEFVVFWSQDLHRPGCRYENISSIRKIIVKIRVHEE